MSSGTVIVQNALRNIGAFSSIAPDDGEAIVLGRDILNSMLQMWLDQGIDLGIVVLDAAGDELGELLSMTQPIIDNLSLLLAPMFEDGKVIVTPTLRTNAITGFATLKDLYQILTIPDVVVSSTLPRGSGNSRFFTRRNFSGSGHTIESTKP